MEEKMNIVVLVDCQNDFIDGSLGVGYDKWAKAYDSILTTVNKVKPEILLATKDMHPVDHCSFKEQGGPWPSHCVDGTAGAQLYWKISNLIMDDYKDGKTGMIYKGQNPKEEEYGVDILGRMPENLKSMVDDAINKGESVNIYLTGLCYDYCVYNCAKETATVNSVFDMNQTISIIRDATVAIDDKAELDVDSYNIKIINSKDL